MQVLSADAWLEATTNDTGDFFSVSQHHYNRLTRFTSEEALSQIRGSLFAYVGVGEPVDQWRSIPRYRVVTEGKSG